MLRPEWFGRIVEIDPEPRWLLVAPGRLGAPGPERRRWRLTLRYSLLGRYAYAIGSNESTARLCGINVPGIKFVIYALGGLAAGLAGVLQFAYLGGVGDPTAASGLELQVIAAVVIGGGSLSGGEGTVLGTLIGCLIMSVLYNGCVHAGYLQREPGHHHRPDHHRRRHARPPPAPESARERTRFPSSGPSSD